MPAAAIPPSFSPFLFWDRDMARLDPERHADYFIRRVFELGLVEDVAEALRYYDRARIVQRKEEKDYRDAHALLAQFSLSRLLAIYREHYPNNSSRIVVDHIAAVEHIPHDDSIRLCRLFMQS